jgi:hypothetical protein
MTAPAENMNEFQDESYIFELTVNESNKVLVFYNKPLKKPLSWLEFDLGTNRLDFVTDDGDAKQFGMPVRSDLAKNMQNAHQVLMVMVDEVTGEALDGEYFPLILHREY